MNPGKRFALSMAAFVVLGLLSWNTMARVPIPVHSKELGIDFSIDFRMVTLAILALLATRTALSYWRSVEERRAAASKEEVDPASRLPRAES